MSSKKRWAGLVGFMGFGMDGGNFSFFGDFQFFLLRFCLSQKRSR